MNGAEPKSFSLSDRVSVRLCVLSIFVLAAIVRFACLGSNPAGVFRDEAEKGYSAYSLARVGGVFDFFAPPDLWSRRGIEIPYLQHWPSFVNVWGSLTSTIYQYSALPFVAIWGPNAWTVRLPAAIVGSLTVLLSFFLARRLTGRLDVALWTMTLMAFSPWHAVFSRWAQQGVFVPLLTTCALLAFLHFIEERRAWRFVLLSSLAFGVAFYAYSGAEPFLIALWLAMAWIFRRELLARWKTALFGAVVLALLVAPTFHALLRDGGAGMGRFERLSVWGAAAPFTTRLRVFLTNYSIHFSPQFLFLTGDPLDRHSLRGFGEMLHVEFPFLLAGVWIALRRRTLSDRFLVGWFLLFPLSAALTNEGIPHALRTLHAVPCAQILSAMGLVEILGWVRKKWGGWARRAVVGLVAANVAVFLIALFAYYPHYSAMDFEYGVREAIQAAREAAREAGAKNARLYVPVKGGAPRAPELYYFLTATPPEIFLEEGTAGAGVWIMRGVPVPSHLGRLLRSGDSVLMSAALFHPGGAYADEPLPPEIERRSIYWFSRPFSKERIEIFRVLSHKGTTP
ncbi:glycosyltransferase family 39 protein [Candidatus Sumerlaeota bacterium]|nr:glycosyltransferase family 39 protein [Candidatus Sumerlaeota bacterium]